MCRRLIFPVGDCDARLISICSCRVAPGLPAAAKVDGAIAGVRVRASWLAPRATCSAARVVMGTGER